MPDPINALYNNLIKSGTVGKSEIGDFNGFVNKITDPKQRTHMYNELIQRGLTAEQLGTLPEFNDEIQKYTAIPAPGSYQYNEQPKVQASGNAPGSVISSNDILKYNHGQPYSGTPENQNVSQGVPQVGDNQLIQKPIPAENPNKLTDSQIKQIGIDQIPVLGDAQAIYQNAWSGMKDFASSIGTGLLEMKSTGSKFQQNLAKALPHDEKSAGWKKFMEETNKDISTANEFSPKLQAWAEKNKPVRTTGVAAMFGQTIPYVGAVVAGMLSGQPELITPLFASSGYGTGLQAYDNHIKKTGQQPNELKRTAAGIGYALALTVPMTEYAKGFGKGILNKVFVKAMDVNPKLAEEAGSEILTAFQKQQPALAKKLIKIFAGGTMTMEAINAVQKGIDQLVIGRNVSGKEWMNSIAHSAVSGIMFSAMTAPFGMVMQNNGTIKRRDEQGYVRLTRDDKGDVLELVPTKDGEVGLTPDNKTVKVTPQQSKDAINIPIKIFNEGIQAVKQSKTLGQEFNKKSYQTTVQNFADRIADPNGNVTRAMVNGQYVFVASTNGDKSLVVDYQGTPTEVSSDQITNPQVMPKDTFIQAEMGNYDNNHPSDEVTQQVKEAANQDAANITKQLTYNDQNLVIQVQDREGNTGYLKSGVYENGNLNGSIVVNFPNENGEFTPEMVDSKTVSIIGTDTPENFQQQLSDVNYAQAAPQTERSPELAPIPQPKLDKGTTFTFTDENGKQSPAQITENDLPDGNYGVLVDGDAHTMSGDEISKMMEMPQATPLPMTKDGKTDWNELLKQSPQRFAEEFSKELGTERTQKFLNNSISLKQKEINKLQAELENAKDPQGLYDANEKIKQLQSEIDNSKQADESIKTPEKTPVETTQEVKQPEVINQSPDVGKKVKEQPETEKGTPETVRQTGQAAGKEAPPVGTRGNTPAERPEGKPGLDKGLRITNTDELKKAVHDLGYSFISHQAMAGSQYITVDGQQFRLSDHYQPSSYQVRNYTDVNSLQEIYDIVSRKEFAYANVSAHEADGKYFKDYEDKEHNVLSKEIKKNEYDRIKGIKEKLNETLHKETVKEPEKAKKAEIAKEGQKAEPNPTEAEKKPKSLAETLAEEERPVTWKPDDLNYDMAYRAYSGISFDPEKRAAQEQKDYVASMQDMYEKLSALAKTPEQKAEMWKQLQNYKEGYLKYEEKYLSAKSRTLSSMITGSSNFPVERNRKAMDTEQKRLQEFLDWDKKNEARALKAVKNAAPQEYIDAERQNSIKKTIDDRLATIISIDKGINTYTTRQLIVNNLSGFIKRMAKNGQADDVKFALQHIKDIQEGLEKPIFSPKNSIWELENTVQPKEDLSNKETQTIAEYKGVKIDNNYSLERVQLRFDEKPSDEIRAKLKSRGFRWSPREGAWQRKNTPEGIRVAENIVKDNFPKEEKSDLRFKLYSPTEDAIKIGRAHV